MHGNLHWKSLLSGAHCRFTHHFNCFHFSWAKMMEDFHGSWLFIRRALLTVLFLTWRMSAFQIACSMAELIINCSLGEPFNAANKFFFPSNEAATRRVNRQERWRYHFKCRSLWPDKSFWINVIFIIDERKGVEGVICHLHWMMSQLRCKWRLRIQ